MSRMRHGTHTRLWNEWLRVTRPMMVGAAAIMIILACLLAQEVVSMVWVVERVVAAAMLFLMWVNGVFGLLCVLSPLLDWAYVVETATACQHVFVSMKRPRLLKPWRPSAAQTARQTGHQWRINRRVVRRWLWRLSALIHTRRFDGITPRHIPPTSQIAPSA